MDSADIQVTKTSSVPSVKVGQNFVYTMTVRNNGPDAAQSVTMSDVLPASVTHVTASLTGPQGIVIVCVITGSVPHNVNCSAPPLQPGEQIVLTMTVKGTAPGLVTNTATGGSVTDDPVPGNNSASAGTLVISEGCGPGFWKNWPSAWGATGYAPGQRSVRCSPAAGGEG